MSSSVRAPEFGDELSRGEFVRQQSRFRDWVGPDTATPGRYHLYVALACPWSHRAVIARRLKRLEDAISISYAHPFRDERGWAFPGDGFRDDAEGFSFLGEGYAATDPAFEGRVSVPVLWDKHAQRIVNNESGDIVRMLNSSFDEWGDAAVDLYPADLRAEIDELNDVLYTNVNNAVYRAGFASSQEAYERAYRDVFATLPELDRRLATRRYLMGGRITESDWRLFVTLVRFDAVYHTHFRLNGARIVDYPNLWGYTRDLYQQPGIADTVVLDEIKRHYYTTHDMLNPSHIIPCGPLALDFDAPHGREAVGAAAP
jgi:glutathionyl-hydroquinone reductase